MHVNGDPRLLRARAIPATEFSRGAAANVLPIFRDFSQKMSLARFGLVCGPPRRAAAFLGRKLASGSASSKLETQERPATAGRTPKKMLKIYGTNPISPLASTKVLKKRTQIKGKLSGKTY